MIDTEELNKEIARLEWEESSYANYSKLADLYTILNQQSGTANNILAVDRGYSFAPADVKENLTAQTNGDSDFLRAVDGKDSVKAWAVMDELMDTLQLTNRRVYDRIIERINSI